MSKQNQAKTTNDKPKAEVKYDLTLGAERLGVMEASKKHESVMMGQVLSIGELVDGITTRVTFGQLKNSWFYNQLTSGARESGASVSTFNYGKGGGLLATLVVEYKSLHGSRLATNAGYPRIEKQCNAILKGMGLKFRNAVHEAGAIRVTNLDNSLSPEDRAKAFSTVCEAGQNTNIVPIRDMLVDPSHLIDSAVDKSWWPTDEDENPVDCTIEQLIIGIASGSEWKIGNKTVFQADPTGWA